MRNKRIGTIGNYYGCLEVKKEGKKYFWCVQNFDGKYWEEIPKHLYDALIKFEKGRK